MISCDERAKFNEWSVVVRFFKRERDMVSGREVPLAKLSQEERDDIAWAQALMENNKKVKGWNDIARFLCVNPQTLRRAYRSEAYYKKVIHTDATGHKWAFPFELMNLMGDIYLWGGASEKKSAYAKNRARRDSAKFANREG